MSSTACLKDSLNDYKTVLGLFEVELIGTLDTDYLKSVTFGIFRCGKGGVYVLYSCRPEVIDIFLGGRSPKNMSLLGDTILVLRTDPSLQIPDCTWDPGNGLTHLRLLGERYICMLDNYICTYLARVACSSLFLDKVGGCGIWICTCTVQYSVCTSTEVQGKCISTGFFGRDGETVNKRNAFACLHQPPLHFISTAHLFFLVVVDVIWPAHKSFHR